MQKRIPFGIEMAFSLAINKQFPHIKANIFDVEWVGTPEGIVCEYSVYEGVSKTSYTGYVDLVIKDCFDVVLSRVKSGPQQKEDWIEVQSKWRDVEILYNRMHEHAQHSSSKIPA
jgi:hypothetical protein